MEIDARVLKEVEFSTSLRGYNTDEVDEFLEQVTIAVERLQDEARAAAERAASAERMARDQPVSSDIDESLRKTLILAQRTADMAIKEAQEEAAQVLERARTEAQTMVEDARDSAARITSEAERRLRDEVERLTASRDDLAREVQTLVDMLGTERARLAESLGTALRYVEHTLTHSSELNRYAAGPPAPAEPEPAYEEAPSYEAQDVSYGPEEAYEEAGPAVPSVEANASDDIDDLEAGIAADAAAAVGGGSGSEDYDWDSVIRGRNDPDFGSPRMSRPTLTALPSRGDALHDTAAWQMRAPRADWPA
jgi:cell division initiation protein